MRVLLSTDVIHRKFAVAKDVIDRKFVVAKTRVAPMKKQFVPRRKLLSAVLLAWLMDTVRSSLTPELKISFFRCFTDSKVALCWICNAEKVWKPFIQNRSQNFETCYLLSVGDSCQALRIQLTYLGLYPHNQHTGTAGE